MNATAAITFAALACACAVTAFAQDGDHPLGQHPAVMVKRQAAHAGYDYAAKFYPHPAWLYLSSRAPEADAAMAMRAAPQGSSSGSDTDAAPRTASLRDAQPAR